jgi:nucleoside-diphosphate-sugar epimerase
MINQNKNWGITGAEGYLGKTLSNYLKERKQSIYCYSRKYSNKNKYELFFDLQLDLSAELFRNIDILIHCAYDFSKIERDEIYKLNVSGSIRLFEAAKKAGVKKIIMISTMSAFEGCKSIYGQAKLSLEKAAEKYGCIIIRPGLIYGKNAGGMIGALLKILKITPVIPVPGSNNILYLIHHDDLAELIFRIGMEEDENRVPSKVFIAAHPEGWRFKDIIYELSKKYWEYKYVIPIPSFFVFWLIRVIERLGIKFNFRSDSLISLLNQDKDPNFNSINLRGFNVRRFSVEGLI